MRSDRRSQRCGIGCGKRKYGLLRAAQMPAHRRQQQRERIQRAPCACSRRRSPAASLPLPAVLHSAAAQVQRRPARGGPSGKTTAGASLRCRSMSRRSISVCARIRARVDNGRVSEKAPPLAKGIRRQIAERCAGKFCEPAGRFGADGIQPMRAAAEQTPQVRRRRGSGAFPARELFSRGIQHIQIVEPPDLRRLQLHADVLEAPAPGGHIPAGPRSRSRLPSGSMKPVRRGVL